MQAIFPPRPRSRMLPQQLARYEGDPLWCAQLKFNGDRTVIYVPVNREVQIFGREGKPFKRYTPPSALLRDIADLNLDKNMDYWFDGELMNYHSTNPEYKNKLILFDVLYMGQPLFLGPTLAQRQNILSEICRQPWHDNTPPRKEPVRGIAIQITSQLWLAETFTHDLATKFQEFIDMPEIEGLMLKRLDSKLDNMGFKEYEIDWMIRCRKPASNYNF